MPCRAAGCCHIVLLGRNLFQEVLSFFNGAHIRTDRHLVHRIKAQLVHGCYQLAGRNHTAELTDKSRRNDGNDPVSLQDGLDHLEDLAFVGNGTKGTAHQTLAAANTLVLIDHRSPLLIRTNGIHAAALCAGPFQMNDRVICASIGTLTALDALGLIDVASAVLKVDRTLGAYLLAGTGQAVLAVFRYLILIGGTGVAGVGNNIDQRGFIILFSNVGSIHALGHQMPTVSRTQTKTHGKPYTLAGNGTLKKYRFPMQGPITGNDGIGQFVCCLIALSGICHPGNFRENFLSNIGDK